MYPCGLSSKDPPTDARVATKEEPIAGPSGLKKSQLEETPETAIAQLKGHDCEVRQLAGIIFITTDNSSGVRLLMESYKA